MAAGRPRKFDPDQALYAAMLVFWSKGYEGTSLPDLTRAMGINRPSLYATFGNKEELFKKVLDKYRSESAAYLVEALARPTAREVFEALLNGAIRLQAGGDNPPGCLLVQGALASGDSAEPIRRELSERRTAAEHLVRERFERAVKENDLPPITDPADLARFTVTLLHGLAVQAANGDTLDSLERVARIALDAFPGRSR